jgi:hypothetical protein
MDESVLQPGEEARAPDTELRLGGVEEEPALRRREQLFSRAGSLKELEQDFRFFSLWPLWAVGGLDRDPLAVYGAERGGCEVATLQFDSPILTCPAAEPCRTLWLAEASQWDALKLWLLSLAVRDPYRKLAWSAQVHELRIPDWLGLEQQSLRTPPGQQVACSVFGVKTAHRDGRLEHTVVVGHAPAEIRPVEVQVRPTPAWPQSSVLLKMAKGMA